MRTGIVCAALGALAGIAVSTSAMQMLIYAALGVWGGALAGGLLGAILCLVLPKRREHPKKLHPAGL